MTKNRLELNFSLITSKERTNFINTYLPTIVNPTPTELETISNYILYGKNENNSSLVDDGYVSIESKSSPWTKKSIDSLDGLLDNANETGAPIEKQYNLISTLNGNAQIESTPYRVPKEVFSRGECHRALSSSNPLLLQEFESLWQSIDELDYLTHAYERYTLGKNRKDRPDLLERLTKKQLAHANSKYKELTSLTYSKKRKLLISLRQQQYVLRDSYAPTKLVMTSQVYSEQDDSLYFDNVLPCGKFITRDSFSNKVFYSEVKDSHFNKGFQSRLLSYVKELDAACSKGENSFDFTNLEHVVLLVYAKGNLFSSMNENEDDTLRNEDLNELLDTLDYYVNVANLLPMHKDILELKGQGKTNSTIAEIVNKTYDKGYSENYISNIFRNKCCEEIVEAARRHWKVVERMLGGKEEFKACSTCKKVLLRDLDFFTKKKTAGDGLSSRCKACDKIIRSKKKDDN